MSADHSSVPAPTSPYTKAMQQGLSAEALATLLAERGGQRDATDLRGLTVRVPAASLRETVRFLRDDPRLQFDTLLDISGTDYLAYPGWRGLRFAVTYLFKSTVFRHRVHLSVALDEDDAEVASIHDLYRIADWAERETFDQFGIVFAGHPNLKRLLNHHEFVGYPLRKDYPCQKRQKLSMSDPMVDQLEARLRAKGYTILDRGVLDTAAPMTVPQANSAGGKS